MFIKPPKQLLLQCYFLPALYYVSFFSGSHKIPVYKFYIKKKIPTIAWLEHLEAPSKHWFSVKRKAFKTISL